MSELKLRPPKTKFLSLALAVLGIRTDDAHDAATMNDLALHANFLNRRANFHFFDAFLTKATCTGKRSGRA
jgi:hypothetical protein